MHLSGGGHPDRGPGGRRVDGRRANCCKGKANGYAVRVGVSVGRQTPSGGLQIPLNTKWELRPRTCNTTNPVGGIMDPTEQMRTVSYPSSLISHPSSSGISG